LIRLPTNTRAFRYWPYAYSVVLFVASSLSHFAILSNDVFPLRWQAERLSFAHPETFYNGFFPIGYPLALRLAEVTGNPVLTLLLVQIALASLYAILSWRLLRQVLPENASLIALPFVLFAPQVVRPMLSPTPDFLAALAVLWGFVLLLSSRGNRAVLFAGAAFGIGYLFRSHIVVLACAILLVLLGMERKNLRTVFSFVLGVLPFILLQGLVQVWSGHGFFENAQVFNVWKTIHGMDWNNPPDLRGKTVLSIILDNPIDFLHACFNGLIDRAAFILPLLIFLIVQARTGRGRRTWAIVVAGSFLYLVITSAGSSPRDVAVLIPVVALCAMYIVQVLLERSRLLQRTGLVLAIIILSIMVGLGGLFYFSNVSRGRIERYAELEDRLGVHSEADAEHIYSDDFDLYFPGLRYTTPRQSGGWPEIGLPGYLAMYPHISDFPAKAEHADLVQNGIEYAIYRIPPYDGRGYATVRSDSLLFRSIYRTPLHEVYRVQR